MNVSLTPELEQFIENLVKKGSYASSSEVVRSGLRLLVKHETAHLQLQALLQEAEEDFKAGRVVQYESQEQALEDIKRHAIARKSKA
jgi:antitoxin ParD1/3/4